VADNEDKEGGEERSQRDGRQLQVFICRHSKEAGHHKPGSKGLQATKGSSKEAEKKDLEAEVGKAYDRHFADAHFAPRGGMPGTTQRLDAWVRAFSAAINAGAAPPILVGALFRFLEAPEPDAEKVFASLDRRRGARALQVRG